MICVQNYEYISFFVLSILFCGKGIPFNLGTELVSIGAMFGFITFSLHRMQSIVRRTMPGSN